MSLAELTEEYERQQARPIRRFQRPRDVLAYVMDSKPTKLEKVTLDMCVLSVEEKDLCWNIFLVEKSTKDDFAKRKKIIEALNDEARAKFVFCLALWKAKKQSRDHVTGADYVPGRSYVVSNVDDLHVYYGVAQGSVQARLVVKDEMDEPRNQKRQPVPMQEKASPSGKAKAVPSKVKSTPAAPTKKKSTLTSKAKVVPASQCEVSPTNKTQPSPTNEKGASAKPATASSKAITRNATAAMHPP